MLWSGVHYRRWPGGRHGRYPPGYLHQQVPTLPKIKSKITDGLDHEMSSWAKAGAYVDAVSVGGV